MKRVLTAAALIPIVVYAVLYANFWIFFGILLAVAVLCYREYNTIASQYGFGAPGPVGYGGGLLMLVWEGETWLLVIAIALLALVLAMREELSRSLPRAALLTLGVVYVFGCWRCALPLREANPHWLMYALLVNWVGDTAAYVVGRKIGRHKLAPEISPKKSWEGAAVAVAGSVLFGSVYLVRFVPNVSVVEAVLLTALANISGQLGDLAESAMKRGAGVKDSGVILPGHGGFLDRVDSTLFSLPLIYGWLQIK
jgi:phosphatidate cytidylyltransferase